MQIKISKEQVKDIADSISEYVFLEVKTDKKHQNMVWLSNFTGFYQKLKTKQSENENVTIDVSDDIKNDLPEIINKYLFSELSKSKDKGKEWLLEMMNVYNQLTADEQPGDGSVSSAAESTDDKAAASEIGDNYDTENRFIKGSKKVAKKKEEIYKPEEEDEPNFVVYEDEAEDDEPDLV